MPYHLSLLLVAAVACSQGQVSSRPHPAAEDVTALNEFGTLHGTLLLPAGDPPFPVVLIIAGSGPVDRNGNQLPILNTNMHRLLAEALAKKGVASLRYDKRGVGASATAIGSIEDIRIEMEATDVNRFIAVLRSDVRLGKLVLAGHSLGALLAILAAEVAAVDGYASLEGAGRPIGSVLREQLARQLSGGTLLAQANAIVEQLEAGRTVSFVPDPLAALFAPSVQRWSCRSFECRR
jgi:pimeloyl-ACP methyl ester carboxylesterase